MKNVRLEQQALIEPASEQWSNDKVHLPGGFQDAVPFQLPDTSREHPASFWLCSATRRPEAADSPLARD